MDSVDRKSENSKLAGYTVTAGESDLNENETRISESIY